MKQVIFILGVTGTGKTTTAQQLAQRLDCDLIEADKFYDYVGVKYHIKEYPRLCNPINWGEVPNITEERVYWYSEKKKGLTKDTLIIEGATPVYLQELKDIEKGLGIKLKNSLFVHLEPNIWPEMYTKKHGLGSNVVLLTDYAREVEKLEDFTVVRIKDVNYLGSPLIYQREGFTDIKWEKLGMKGRDLTGKTVLDLGCNSGWFAKYCKEQNVKAYTGVDNQIKEIIYARHLFEGEFVHRDIEVFLNECIEKERTFDICVMASTLHYFDNKEQIIEKISKITNEFVLEIPISQKGDAKEYIKPGKDYTIPTTKLVFNWLEKYFTTYSLIGESIPPDGSFRLVFSGIMEGG